MAVNKVDLYVSQILEDLNNGMTWLKKDDLGYGSIESKYNAKEQQIAVIRKHPKLKDAETTVTIFNIIDDTKQELVEAPIVKTEVVKQPELVQETTSVDDFSAFQEL
jgi:hypothetical protein